MNDSGDRAQTTAFGPYRVVGHLGSGAMGHVYRALAPDGTCVALKILRAELSGDIGFQARFAREARIAREVRHPNLVAVVDAGTIDGAVYMAQQFVDGEPLEARLHDAGPLTVRDTVRLVTEVAGALDALAAAKLVHRDVKPANILLDRGGRALLTDFGLAKDLAGPALTRPGQTLGSMDYMAPEQVQAERLSAATDVYALACVAFQCLTGRTPFAHHPKLQVMLAHLDEPPPDPCGLWPQIPTGVGAAVVRALAKSAAGRPATAGAFADELREASST